MARFEEFWKLACDYQIYLRIGFMMMVFFFILSVLGLWLAEPGTGAYAISIVNFAMVAVMGLVLAYMNRVCANRARQYY